jgi:hypothetical protein
MVTATKRAMVTGTRVMVRKRVMVARAARAMTMVPKVASSSDGNDALPHRER